MASLYSLETLAIGARYTGLLPDGAATITELVPREDETYARNRSANSAWHTEKH